MKKILLTAVLVMAATSAYADIKGSKHDMTSTGGSSGYHNAADAADQLCVYCHTPHNNKKSALLWNRNDGASLTLYDKSVSATLNYSTAPALAASSKECMSCHDGTIAIDEYGTHAGTASKKIGNAGTVVGNNPTANLGTDLTKTHPVGFVYWESSSNDTGLKSVSAQTDKYVVGNVDSTKLTLYPNAGATAYTMECATCHDVHGKTVPAKFLRVNNAGSNLCLSCHLK